MYVDIVISNIFHLNKHFFFLSFSRACKGYQGLTKALKGLQVIARACKGSQGLARGLKYLQGLSRACKGYQGLARALKGLQWLSRACKGSQGLARALSCCSLAVFPYQFYDNNIVVKNIYF